MKSEKIPSIEPYDWQWIKDHKIDLQYELERTPCLRTGREFNGNLSNVTIACIDDPYPRLLWWFCNPNNRRK